VWESRTLPRLNAKARWKQRAFFSARFLGMILLSLSSSLRALSTCFTCHSSCLFDMRSKNSFLCSPQALIRQNVLTHRPAYNALNHRLNLKNSNRIATCLGNVPQLSDQDRSLRADSRSGHPLNFQTPALVQCRCS
jgi:hypothetical protein